MPRPLEQLQSGFAAALVDPAGAQALALQFGAHADRALDRLALYRGNVVAAREQALAAAYPVVRALVGEEFFAALARRYGSAYPSVSGDLNRFGARLPEFVHGFERARELPYLGDVAALEWLVHRAHYAADAEALARGRLGDLAAEYLLGARFDLHPACAWLSSDHPVVAIWLAHQRGGHALPATLDRREHALVVRPRWHATVLASSAGELAALTLLRAGADMECAIGAALAVEPRFDFARALVRWLDHAVIVGMRAAPAAPLCGAD